MESKKSGDSPSSSPKADEEYFQDDETLASQATSKGAGDLKKKASYTYWV